MVQLGAVLFWSPFLFISPASGTIKAQCQMKSAPRRVKCSQIHISLGRTRGTKIHKDTVL